MEGDQGAAPSQSPPRLALLHHCTLQGTANHSRWGGRAPTFLDPRHPALAPWQCKTQPPYCGRGPLQLTSPTNYNFCSAQQGCGCSRISEDLESVARNSDIGFGTAGCIWGKLFGHSLSTLVDGTRAQVAIKLKEREQAQHTPSLGISLHAQHLFAAGLRRRWIPKDVLHHSPGPLPVQQHEAVR